MDVSVDTGDGLFSLIMLIQKMAVSVSTCKGKCQYKKSALLDRKIKLDMYLVREKL